MLTPWKKSYDQPREHIQKQGHYFSNKGLSSEGSGFSSGHVWMWELDCEERWSLKNWCFWTVVLEKTPESPLDCKEIQPVHSEGDQPWDFFGRNDAEAEAPILWSPHEKSWPIGKDSDAGRDWGQEEKGTTEDAMAGWHHGLNGRESEWTPGFGDGQGGLVCCNLWGSKESDMTEWLKWTELLISSRIRSDRQSTWRIKGRDSWYCTGGSDQDYPQEKEMQKGKMLVWGGLKIAEKRREAKVKEKRKDRPIKCRVPKNSK